MVVVESGYRRSCEYDVPHHYNSDHEHHHHCDHECGGEHCGAHHHDCYPFRYTPTPNQPVRENLFVINETTPYLVDGTQYKYGPIVSAAHDIETRVINRHGVACVNLDAVFDLTEKITTNAAWEQYLEQLISMKYEDIQEILSMVKSTIVFRMYYKIMDSSNEEVMRAYCDSPCQCGFINPVGDVKDYFVSSYKNIFTDMISSVPFSGLYTLNIIKVEAIIDTCVLRDIIPSGEMNSYYAFSNNNTQINVFHDSVKQLEPTEAFVIAVCDVNKSFTFETNVTTKLKVSYTAFLNNMIVVPNTLGIWNSLFDPTEVIIKELRDKNRELEERIVALEEKFEELETKVDTKLQLVPYDYNLELRKGDITWNELGKLFQVVKNYRTTDDEEVILSNAFNDDILAGKIVSIYMGIDLLPPGDDEGDEDNTPEEPGDDITDPTNPPSSDEEEPTPAPPSGSEDEDPETPPPATGDGDEEDHDGEEITDPDPSDPGDDTPTTDPSETPDPDDDEHTEEVPPEEEIP